MTSRTSQQVAAAAAMLRPFGAVVVLGAGVSAGGYPMTAQLPPLLWQAIDASPEATAQLRSVAGRAVSAKDILGAEVAGVWSLLRTFPTARAAFQTAFTSLDGDREPSPAHFDLARLLNAGVVEAVVSYNWDTCLERAHEQLYGVALPVGMLHKPHGDAARPEQDWVFPDEAGVVPSDVRNHVRRLSDRPRALVMVGYSGSDAAVVEALLEPLEERWPVVRIGPSALGEGAIACGADEALAGIASHLLNATARSGWKYVTFLHSRSFLAALQGERLRPSDVDACPELPSAARLVTRLLSSKFATLSGASGTGKSVTAFHAARRLNRRGWKVVELTQAGVAASADVEQFQHLRGPVLAVVDDAQAIEADVLSMLESSIDEDHAVLLVSTERLETRNDETLSARQSVTILHNYCVANIDAVAALLSQLDDRVRWSAFAEQPDHRLRVAAHTAKEPWLYMFIASGGERRIAGALDRAVDDVDAAVVLGAVCVAQMISRDAGVTRSELEGLIAQNLTERLPAPSLRLHDRLDRTLLLLGNERLIREHDGRIRAVHIRVAERALQDLGARGDDGVGDTIRFYVRSALLSLENDVAGKFWLLRVFDHHDVYRYRFAESIVDGDVAAELLREALDSAPGPQRGVALNALWTSRWFRPLTAAAAEQLATAIIDWLPQMEASEVNGYRWILSDLRAAHKQASDRICAAVDPSDTAARLSSAGSRRSAHDWANVIQELSPAWDDDDGWLSWSERFEQSIDQTALAGWLHQRDENSHPFEIYELIDTLAGFAPRAAKTVFEACADEIRQAMASDLADATSNFAEWVFGTMSLVARIADAPTAFDVGEDDPDVEPDDQETIRRRHMNAKEPDLRVLAATVLDAFERVDWVASARSLDGKRKFQLHSLDLVFAWLSYLSTDITDRLAAGLSSEWLLGLIKDASREPGDTDPFGAVGFLFHLSYGPQGETVVRTFLEDNEADIITLPAPFVRRFPEIAARLIGEGRGAEPRDPHGLGWQELTAQLRAIADVDQNAAVAWLGRIADVVSNAFCHPQTNDLTCVAEFIDLADGLDTAVLDAVVGRIDPATVAAAWTARVTDAGDAVQPLLHRILRVRCPAADLAAVIISDQSSR